MIVTTTTTSPNFESPTPVPMSSTQLTDPPVSTVEETTTTTPTSTTVNRPRRTTPTQEPDEGDTTSIPGLHKEQPETTLQQPCHPPMVQQEIKVRSHRKVMPFCHNETTEACLYLKIFQHVFFYTF